MCQSLGSVQTGLVCVCAVNDFVSAKRSPLHAETSYKHRSSHPSFDILNSLKTV